MRYKRRVGVGTKNNFLYIKIIIKKNYNPKTEMKCIVL